MKRYLPIILLLLSVSCGGNSGSESGVAMAQTDNPYKKTGSICEGIHIGPMETTVETWVAPYAGTYLILYTATLCNNSISTVDFATILYINEQKAYVCAYNVTPGAHYGVGHIAYIATLNAGDQVRIGVTSVTDAFPWWDGAAVLFDTQGYNVFQIGVLDGRI